MSFSLSQTKYFWTLSLSLPGMSWWYCVFVSGVRAKTKPIEYHCISINTWVNNILKSWSDLPLGYDGWLHLDRQTDSDKRHSSRSRKLRCDVDNGLLSPFIPGPNMCPVSWSCPYPNCVHIIDTRTHGINVSFICPLCPYCDSISWSLPVCKVFDRYSLKIIFIYSKAYTECTKHKEHLPNIELHPLLPSKQSGHGLYKVSKAFYGDAGPCWLQCFPQLFLIPFYLLSGFSSLHGAFKVLQSSKELSLCLSDRLLLSC